MAWEHSEGKDQVKTPWFKLLSKRLTIEDTVRQVLQHVKSSELNLETVPPPALLPGGIRVRTAASLISAGTEKMMIELAQKSMVGMARSRPDLVRQVVNKAKKEGWYNTFQAVMAKMERPMPLGYSAAGVVEAVGGEITTFKIGERVAVAGAGYASHAEVNAVPANLASAIPEGVSFEEAAYTTVASIALQGVRIARPELGDNVVVVGLGLIGLIAVQLLKANGCRVFGIDLDPSKVELGRRLGMDGGTASGGDEAVHAAEAFTKGRGADHTLITAATKSNGPVEMAGEITRRRGQVVVVGAVGMTIPRDAYYKKELELKISMSYGPGRYDPSYEEGGVDYPYDYVRWTEQRNMEAVLALMAEGRLDVHTLTTHRYPFDRALQAYELIQEGKEPYVGVLLEYDVEKPQEPVVRLREVATPHAPSGTLRVGFVGAGNYAARFLIPHLQKASDVELAGLATATGLNAQQKADKFGFAYCTTDVQALLNDEAIDAVFVGTRHSTHAEFAVRALEVGKHVFVEKPMVVSEEELADVRAAYEAANARRPTGLMVGLNRRFAPMVTEMKEALPSGPKQMLYRINSGLIPTTSWLHQPEEGGGMLVGEMCHFIDLMQFVCGERPTRVYAQALQLGNELVADHDNIALTITFSGGSVGTLGYSTVGDKAASKERLEVYGGGTVAVLDDFRRLELTQNGKRSRSKASNQDKGQAIQVAQTVEAFRTRGTAPIAFEELVVGMEVVFAARRSLVSGEAEEVAGRTAPVTVPA